MDRRVPPTRDNMAKKQEERLEEYWASIGNDSWPSIADWPTHANVGDRCFDLNACLTSLAVFHNTLVPAA